MTGTVTRWRLPWRRRTRAPGGTMTNIRSGGNTDPVAVGNRAADAWAKADPRAVVLTAASDDGQAALGRAADAFTDAGWTGAGRGGSGNGWLPGFDPGPGPLATIPILSVLHAGGLEAFQRGHGAPWPLRIAYETLIDVPAAARDGGIARLEYPLQGTTPRSG